MKNRIMKSALTLCLFAMVGFASSAHATLITITFDEAAGTEAGGNYTVDGWTFTNVALNPGNCDAGDCINFTVNNGDITLSHVDGFVFTLSEFWVNFQSTQGGVHLAMSGDSPTADDIFGEDVGTDATLVTNGIDYDLGEGTLLTFQRLGTGNLRLDTFDLNFTGDNGQECPPGATLPYPQCFPDPEPVPEPGTLGLLGLGLLGLAMGRRRKV